MDSIFSVGVRGKTASQTNHSVEKHQHLPRKILVSKTNIQRLIPAFKKKSPVHIVEDEKKEYSSFFKDNIKEVIAVPIQLILVMLEACLWLQLQQ